ncbi:MAG: hypothetical protein M1820_001053 [Bogoriella megaspora]|nr:MAG: hypothetical protein M1820_001053 [Bogoriella megaspora]
MATTRTFALRAVARSSFVRPTLKSAAPRHLQRITRRTYADGGHAQPKSSDLTWALAATAVTVPGAWYLLQPAEGGHHGGDHGHEEGQDEKHGEEGEGEGEGESEGEGKDTPQEEGEGEEESQEGKPKVSETEGKEFNKSDTDELQRTKPADEDEGASKKDAHVVEQESKGNAEGVQFKGKTSQGDEDNEMTDTRKHIPDAKGGAKKRIDSGYGVPQAPADAEREDESGSSQDKAVASKEPLSQNQMSGKQRGLSNTETKHSTDIANNPEKSRKGEGTPETAKSMGTVKVDRPTAENKESRGTDNA